MVFYAPLAISLVCSNASDAPCIGQTVSVIFCSPISVRILKVKMWFLRFQKHRHHYCHYCHGNTTFHLSIVCQCCIVEQAKKLFNACLFEYYRYWQICKTQSWFLSWLYTVDDNPEHILTFCGYSCSSISSECISWTCKGKHNTKLSI